MSNKTNVSHLTELVLNIGYYLSRKIISLIFKSYWIIWYLKAKIGFKEMARLCLSCHFTFSVFSVYYRNNYKLFSIWRGIGEGERGEGRLTFLIQICTANVWSAPHWSYTFTLKPLVWSQIKIFKKNGERGVAVISKLPFF